jgi:hypothetical protein
MATADAVAAFDTDTLELCRTSSASSPPQQENFGSFYERTTLPGFQFRGRNNARVVGTSTVSLFDPFLHLFFCSLECSGNMIAFLSSFSM